MDCKVAIDWTHQYMDGEFPQNHTLELKKHLLACPECRLRFEQLERTEALVNANMKNEASLRTSVVLTARIMESLPKQSQAMNWTRWIRRHPALTSAALFILVMFSSFLFSWDNGSTFTVTGNDIQQVVIDGKTVTVPEGVSINGDLTVANGRVDIQGDVNGNVTVIDGSLFLASTAHIAGQTKQIDKTIDWLWYKVTGVFEALNN